jgi:uncharacterized DUF497 family protein
MTSFEWDEAKRRKNIERHGLDFYNGRAMFDGRDVLTALSRYENEARLVSTAVLADGKFYSVVWTWRLEKRRIISFRRARDGEEREYRQLYR